MNRHKHRIIDFALIYNSVECRNKPAAQSCRRYKINGSRQPDQIEISLFNPDILGKGSPVCKSRLKMVVTNMLIAFHAPGACGASAAKWGGDTITRLKLGYFAPDFFHDPRKLMPRHMGQAYIRVVPFPPMPVAPA
jgi:hypothetical protein